MDNLQATSYLCTAICSSFYPDERSINIALFNAEIDATATATPKDKQILKVAVSLVYGYVEASRGEGGISVSTDRTAIDKAIRHFAREYGVNEDELLDSTRVVENGSFLW